MLILFILQKHFEASRIICEPLNNVSNVRVLSICDRIRDIELLDWESLSDFENLEVLDIHEHFRLKTKSSKLVRAVEEILKILDEANIRQTLRCLSMPVHRSNIESKYFTKFIESKPLRLEEISFHGFANDKRDADRLRYFLRREILTVNRIIEPVNDMSNLNSLHHIKTLTVIEFVEISCSKTDFISSLAALFWLKIQNI